MITALDHAQITVPPGSEAAAREFYCDFLGLKETEKPDNRKAKGGFWLQIGPSQVHVSMEDGVDRLKTRAHLAYKVSDLEEWRAKFTAKGFKVNDSPPFPNAKAFELRDPFGNRLEMIQYF